MSQTSAAGGGAVTPGWYTDPHDPRQLRWWSGEGWTEHVSAGSGQQAAEAAAAVPAQVAPAQVTPAADQPLPSRRALRDPATEASEAAEAALAAQAAQQQAQAAAAQQQAAQQQATQQAAQQQAWDAQQAAVPPVQPIQPQVVQPEAVQPQFDAPVAAQQPSAPVPTLPVAPTSFLEQQGYAPLDGSAPGAGPTQGGWSQPAAAPAAAAPPNAWDQPAQPVQPIQPQQPGQPVQPNAWNQPVQPDSAQPNAWNQPLQPVQPVQPVQPTAPEQQGWGATANDGIDSLFGGAPSGQVAAQTPQAQNVQAGQWGLTPSDGESGGRRQAAEVAEVAGSSTLWAWLIAISPILAAGAVAYVMLTVKPAFTDWQFEAAVAAPYLLVLLFAVADRAALLQLGHSQPRSPGWALLSAPIYLIARAGETRREDGSGTALTLVWFFSVLVAAGGIVGYGFLTHHALIAGLPT